MSKHPNTDKEETSTKRMKLNDEKYCGIEALNDEHRLPDIFRLNLDCFEELFDFLSLQELISVARTCKRMQRIAGHCYQQNYGSTETLCYDDGFYFDEGRVDCFKSQFKNVSFKDGTIKEDLESSDDENSDETDEISSSNPSAPDFMAQLTDTTSLQRIDISGKNLTMDRIKKNKILLSRAESVTTDCSYCHDNHVFNALMSVCSKAKYLSISGIIDNHEWMYRSFPNLMHLELTPFRLKKLPELKIFFKVNTTIKHLSIDSTTFWSSRMVFKSKNSNFKLNTLSIIYLEGTNFTPFCHLLKELYELGLYKSLYFYCGQQITQEHIDQLVTIKGLGKFHTESHIEEIAVGGMENVEELCIDQSRSLTDLQSLPHILSNLKRIEFKEATSDDILLFIRHAWRVNKIKVTYLEDGLYFNKNEQILDLFALNKERGKLNCARKIVIYVDEDVYLATKWAMKKTDFRLIEMKRITSFDWRHEFEVYYK